MIGWIGCCMIGHFADKWQWQRTLLGPSWTQLCIPCVWQGRLKATSSVWFSDNHATEQCPESWQRCSSASCLGSYRPATPFHYPQVGPVTEVPHPPGLPSAPLPMQVCRLFNKPERSRCTFSPCKFVHSCIVSNGPHPSYLSSSCTTQHLTLHGVVSQL